MIRWKKRLPRDSFLVIKRFHVQFNLNCFELFLKTLLIVLGFNFKLSYCLRQSLMSLKTIFDKIDVFLKDKNDITLIISDSEIQNQQERPRIEKKRD